MAIALTGILLPALATSLAVAYTSRPSSVRQLQAAALLHEATDAVQNVRDQGWQNIAADGTYHPVISSNAWTLASGPETINGFTRKIVITTAERSTTGILVASGGTADPSTKIVTATVSWESPSAGSLSSTAYLSRWQHSAVWTQTTESDFSAGTFDATTAAAEPDSVELSDTPPSWGVPSIPGTYDLSGSNAATAVYVSGNYAYVGYNTGMAILDISNPAAPALVGTYTTTAAVKGIYVSGTTAYLATAMATSQLVLVDVSAPSAPTAISSLAVGDTAAANALTVNGNYVYIVKNRAASTANGEFNIINISTPSAPVLTGKLRINANMTGLALDGNYAYVSTAKKNGQLTVVKITNPARPTSAATVNLGATADSIALAGSSVYVGTATNSTGGEFRIYDISSPTAPSLVGSYETATTVYGIGVSGGIAQLGTTTSGKQLITLDISTPSAPTLISDISVGGRVNALSVDGLHAYLGTSASTKEFQIAQAGYPAAGTFESQTFDAGSSAGFNYLSFTASVPAKSTLRLQVAVNDDDSTWNFIGPDGTAGTYFTASGATPFSAVGRYFRYKAYFTPTTDGTQTPVLNDVEAAYSL